VSGFSEGAGPGGQMGKCLLGIGTGHAADVLILSKLRVGVRGCGDEERVCSAGIGRGRAIVAISATASATRTSSRCVYVWLQHVRGLRRGGEGSSRNAAGNGVIGWRYVIDKDNRNANMAASADSTATFRASKQQTERVMREFVDIWDEG
jgi:hypothetical protein